MQDGIRKTTPQNVPASCRRHRTTHPAIYGALRRRTALYRLQDRGTNAGRNQENRPAERAGVLHVAQGDTEQTGLSTRRRRLS